MPPDIKPSKLIEQLCVHFGLPGDAKGDSRSEGQDPLKLTIKTGSAAAAAELCEPLKLRLSASHILRPSTEEEGDGEEEEVGIKLSG